MGKSTRRKLCVGESRMWCVNLRSNEILVEYIEGNSIESVLGITTNDTKDLKNLTVQQKNEILKQYDLTRGSAQKFYASRTERYTVLRPNNQKIMISGTSHIHNFEVLVCKFYHQCANQNFFKYFKYKGGTMLEKKIPTYYKTKVYICTKQDWWLSEMPEYDIYLPEKYSKTMGFSVMDLTLYFLWTKFKKQ